MTRAPAASRRLAAVAADIGRQAGRADPLTRRAALCAAVSLAETTSPAAARRYLMAGLADIGRADLAPAALQIIDLITPGRTTT